MKVPLLNFVGGPGVPLLNFEGGPGVPLSNLRWISDPTFKLWGGSQGPRVLVPLLHHAFSYKKKVFISWFIINSVSCDFKELSGRPYNF